MFARYVVSTNANGEVTDVNVTENEAQAALLKWSARVLREIASEDA